MSRIESPAGAAALKAPYRSLVEKSSDAESTPDTLRGDPDQFSELQLFIRDATARREVAEELRRSELLHCDVAGDL